MSQDYSNHNYYDVLEISSSSPQHEIHRSYLKAKDTYAPDSPALYTMFTREEAEELLNLIEEAFLVLSDPIKRQRYDEYLKYKELKNNEEFPDFNPYQEQTLNDNNEPPLLEMLLNDVEQPEATAAKVKQTVADIRAGNNIATEVQPKSDVIPDGFQKTKLSVYPVNSEMENVITLTEECTGEFLSKVRQYKQIDLHALSKETRISKTYIAAIEAEDFEALPANVFVRGFVVQISKVLGLNSEKMASTYMSRVKKGR